jgi:hypothetical protein
MPPLGKREISFSTKRRRSWKIKKTEGKLAPYRASRAPHCLKRHRLRRPWAGAWSCYLLTRSNMARTSTLLKDVLVLYPTDLSHNLLLVVLADYEDVARLTR